jgi:carbon storage regulator CsrA
MPAHDAIKPANPQHYKTYSEIRVSGRRLSDSGISIASEHIRFCNTHPQGLEEDKTEGTMLILSRRVGERILIGPAIEVIVQRVSGDRVTLGLAAPREVKILRGELENYDDPLNPQPVAVGARHHANDPPAPATGSLTSFSRRRVPR